MLRVTVEIVPMGDEDRRRTIGLLEIHRTTVCDNPETYCWQLLDPETGEWLQEGQVIAHRYGDGAWELVRRAVEVLVLGG